MRATHLGQCVYDVRSVAYEGGTAGPFGAYAAVWVAYIGQELVPSDASRTNGWDYNRTTGQATFYGDACASLGGEPAKTVTVVGARCPLGPA